VPKVSEKSMTGATLAPDPDLILLLR
jgi:hypothetical protein